MKKTKIIQVPMPSDFLAELDAAARERGASRAAFIREACAEYIASSRREELIRKDIEGYMKHPQSEEEAAALESLATEVLEPEDW
jgi:metal-responsive CopG/Arc/MetJ family transcriptional regulator